ncbi:MAG: ABC transporter permease [Candidatus Didemnitutus sp.]|nr:ABC transporter permease [Candidatus Didemnitutus sp.]
MGTALNSFRAGLRREWADLRTSRLARVQLLWLPLGCVALLWAVFARGVATGLPVTVVDLDRSSASRQLVRALDATPGLAVRARPETLADGQAAVRRGTAEAVVLVPRDFMRRLKRGEAAEVTAWFNAQFLLTGNVVARELQSAVLTFSAQAEARARLARGEPRVAVGISLQPVAARRDTLHNPSLNYLPFLVAGLSATVVQMLAMLAAVRAVGRELRDGTAGEWLAASGGRIGPAVAAKCVLPVAAGSAAGAAFLAGLHGWYGWPMPGSWLMLLGALLLMVLAYTGLGLLVTALTANYRLASSVAAFVTAPALAFAGLTFPLGSMPGPAEIWGQLLPLTTFLRLQIEQAGRGAAAAGSAMELLILGAVTVVTFAAALPLLAWRARDPRCWGRR